MDSEEVMISDNKLRKIISESDTKGLIWYNNYEDIGEDRQYLGQW